MAKMNEDLVTFGGWITTLVGGIIVALVHWRKGSVDETAVVLDKWKQLVEAHQSQISTLTGQIRDLTERLERAEKRIRELEDENAGLKRAIIQNSRATAIQLGKPSRGSNREELP